MTTITVPKITGYAVHQPPNSYTVSVPKITAYAVMKPIPVILPQPILVNSM